MYGLPLGFQPKLLKAPHKMNEEPMCGLRLGFQNKFAVALCMTNEEPMLDFLWASNTSH